VHWIVGLIMASALVAVLKTFNGNMVASSRLLFAMGRRNMLGRRMAHIHPVNQPPSIAVIAVGVATVVALFLGEALLIPILEVGAIAAAVAWMSACASYYRMKRAPRLAAALSGLLVTSLMGAGQDPSFGSRPLHRLRVDRVGDLGGPGGANLAFRQPAGNPDAID
jgi:amino acid transporter